MRQCTRDAVCQKQRAAFLETVRALLRCQTFSSLGTQAGVDDPRGKLANFSIEYIKAHRPTAVVAENVAALPCRHRGFLESILDQLKQASYRVWWTILDTKDYGIPQRRQRWYLVAIREGSARRAANEDTIFPAPLGFTV